MDIETGFRTTMHTFSTKDTHKLEDQVRQSKKKLVNRHDGGAASERTKDKEEVELNRARRNTLR